MTSILIVDDDPAVRSFVGALLSRHGYFIEAARDGEEALEHLRQRPWDAMILDLLMPRMNGFEVLAHIKALDPDTLRGVIVLTGAGEQTLRYFDSSAIHALLRKPVSKSDLLDAVRRCAGVSERSRTAAEPIGRAGMRV